jgi:pimeloyl-ACP methyl ester carboxylesterase
MPRLYHAHIGLKGERMAEVGKLDRGDGVELAWAKVAGRSPTVVFLPGFGSDMAGEKATTLADWCAAHGQGMLRLDYSGHGVSGGAFTDGSIGRWMADARCVIEAKSRGELLLVGSSMGGWISLLLGRAMPERVAGIVGIAAAPDFTVRMWDNLTPQERAALDAGRVVERPSQYGDPYRLTRGLFEDGLRHLLLHAPLPIACPVRLLHGQQDDAVAWEQVLKIAERLASADVQVVLVKDGDHRLSRPQDLILLRRTVAGLLGEDGA